MEWPPGLGYGNESLARQGYDLARGKSPRGDLVPETVKHRSESPRQRPKESLKPHGQCPRRPPTAVPDPHRPWTSSRPLPQVKFARPDSCKKHAVVRGEDYHLSHVDETSGYSSGTISRA